MRSFENNNLSIFRSSPRRSKKFSYATVLIALLLLTLVASAASATSRVILSDSEESMNPSIHKKFPVGEIDGEFKNIYFEIFIYTNIF